MSKDSEMTDYLVQFNVYLINDQLLLYKGLCPVCES